MLKFVIILTLLLSHRPVPEDKKVKNHHKFTHTDIENNISKNMATIQWYV